MSIKVSGNIKSSSPRLLWVVVVQIPLFVGGIILLRIRCFGKIIERSSKYIFSPLISSNNLVLGNKISLTATPSPIVIKLPLFDVGIFFALNPLKSNSSISKLKISPIKLFLFIKQFNNPSLLTPRQGRTHKEKSYFVFLHALVSSGWNRSKNKNW